jgi:hypothetical protein
MIEGKDFFYIEEDGGKRIVFTKEFLKGRGTCCGSGCMECPYEPKHERGSKVLK